jgi:hypothetical protein
VPDRALLLIVMLVVAAMAVGYFAGYEDAKDNNHCDQIGGGSAIGPDGKMGAYKVCAVKS